MKRKNLSYEERERRRKEQLSFNDSYLEGFANHLERKGLSEETADKHYMRMGTPRPERRKRAYEL